MATLSTDEVRGVQLDLLRKIDQYCSHHGIRYQLGWGTLLGAVRHRGYIPWDDDIDLTMTRTEFQRFCYSFDHAPIPDAELFAVGRSSGWPYPFAKVSDTHTVLREETRHSWPLGVNVDIFPVDGWEGGISGAFRLWAVRLLRALLTVHGLTTRPGRSARRSIAMRLMQPLVRLLPAAWIARTWDRTAAASRSESPAMGVFVGPRSWWVNREAFDEEVELEFEGGTYPAPRGWIAVLESTYGDFMSLPPMSQRATHHDFVVTWKL